MIQPGRFKIHETTKVWTVVTDRGAPTWRSFPITRRTAFSVFIALDEGERRIDRLPLERNGMALSHGVTYYLRRHALPDESEIADAA